MYIKMLERNDDEPHQIQEKILWIIKQDDETAQHQHNFIKVIFSYTPV